MSGTRKIYCTPSDWMLGLRDMQDGDKIIIRHASGLQRETIIAALSAQGYKMPEDRTGDFRIGQHGDIFTLERWDINAFIRAQRLADKAAREPVR